MSKKGQFENVQRKKKKGQFENVQRKKFPPRKKPDGPSVAKVSEVKGLSLTSRLQIANLFAD